MTKSPCPLCESAVDVTRKGPDTFAIRCPVCHDFTISEQAIGELEKPTLKARRYVIAGVARNASDAGTPITILSHNVQELIDSAPVSQTPLDTLDKLLVRVAERSGSFYGATRVRLTEWPVYYLRSSSDLKGILNFGLELGYVADIKVSTADVTARLTAAGWKRVQELRERSTKSRQAFVAMYFHEDLKSAYTHGIKPALEETGYDPLRIDAVHHNEKIDDKIVAELRRSGLVVADFTGHRGGVYYEAGYAQGRGIPVIWCCKQSEIEHAHFDTRQYNHLTWTTPEELREKLRDRIRATLPTYPPIS